MDTVRFKRLLTAFADTPASIDISKGKLVCEIRDGMIEADIRAKDGEIVGQSESFNRCSPEWQLTEHTSR